MDKLTKFEIKILSYLDKKIDNTSNKDQVFKLLKDEFVIFLHKDAKSPSARIIIDIYL